MSGYDAYKRTLSNSGSTRDTEYRLLGQVTSALLKVREIMDRTASDPQLMAQYADALVWNKQVWDVFIEDCGTAGNQLPRELRAAIISLGLWVTRETDRALAGDGDLDSLIAVNKDIMKGLRPQVPQEQAKPAAGGVIVDSA